MILIYVILVVVVLSLVIIPFINSGVKGTITMISVISMSLLSSIPAVKAITGESIELFLSGTIVTSTIPIRIDGLSAWFMLTINFTFITALFMG